MIKHAPGNLDPILGGRLKAWQDTVDNAADWPARVASAKETFEQVRPSASFEPIKAHLLELCPGVERCAYCEDSHGSQVEHIQPKYWYPERVFVFENYLMACGDCNGPKSDRYAVFEAGQTQYTEFKRIVGSPAPPPTGDHVLINPRLEDPFDYIELDLQKTFRFTPKAADKESRDYSRADYTITLLRLNLRDSLPKARKGAFFALFSQIRDYMNQKGAGVDQGKLDDITYGIQSISHRTVFEEMKRQRHRFVELEAIFDACPELLMV